MKRVILLHGVPFSQKRARATSVGGFTRMYDPSKSEKAIIKAQIMEQAPTIPTTDPVKIVMCFVMPRPDNHYGTGKNAGVLKASAPAVHTSKPDLDNMEKIILDSMNKLYFRDDSQVCVVLKKKIYGESPKTEILLQTLTKDGEINDE